MKIELFYGDGFSGRSFYLHVGEKSYNLLGVTSSSNEGLAREKAKEILESLGIDKSILNDLKFVWNGTL